MKYNSVYELIENQINTNGNSYTNMFNSEMALLVYGDEKYRNKVAKELKLLEHHGLYQ
jgi:hypothetical protein